MSFLSVKQLTKVFKLKSGKKLLILDQLELFLGKSEKVAILGRSGSGKSTLLHILGTLDTPTSGSVTLNEKSVFDYSETQLCHYRNRNLGFVFQHHYLLNEFSALENVMMPALIAGKSQLECQKRARFLLDRVGLKEREGHRPSQMSGGEQQRVSIARAIMMRPQLLLTDEMTGNLDPETGQGVFRLLEELHEEMGMTLISVTHDHVLAKRYDKVLSLEKGKLVAASLM